MMTEVPPGPEGFEPVSSLPGRTGERERTRGCEIADLWNGVADGEQEPIGGGMEDEANLVGKGGTATRAGRMAGQFKWVHNIGIDSKGNLYTAEVGFGRRTQKFRRLD